MGEEPSYLLQSTNCLSAVSTIHQSYNFLYPSAPAIPLRIKSAGILAQARVTSVFLFILVGSWFSYVRGYSAVTKLGDQGRQGRREA